MYILVLNVGSSSVKAALFIGDKDHPNVKLELVWKGNLSAREAGFFILIRPSEKEEEVELKISSLYDGLPILLENLWKGDKAPLRNPGEVKRIVHRIVHGGSKFLCPTVITPEVKQEIQNLFSIAPLHNPPGLRGIEMAEKIFPNSMQVAIFDTSFHQTISEVGSTYPGPYEWREQGIRRYGFHGISYSYCTKRAIQMLRGIYPTEKMICCHLGNGCSITAIRNGKSAATSMGFTPLEGLMMGTRSGSIDPGILTYLMRHENYDVDSLDRLLNQESGLKGISGESPDMRWIISQKENNPRAQLAFDLFVYTLKFYIGAMTTVLEGLDVLIFTAGIGENVEQVRAETCNGLSYLGLHLDMESNHRCIPDEDISRHSSSARILVIHTQEEMAMAQACLEI